MFLLAITACELFRQLKFTNGMERMGNDEDHAFDGLQDISIFMAPFHRHI
jgi:hypothetical protein